MKEANKSPRAEILEMAVDLASTEGLEGLTIGRLAGELQMSKSGLFSHFGSKEQLQLATVDAAAAIFRQEVEAPSAEAPAGLARLVATTENWLAYMEAGVFSGGCFFAAASAEFDDRPGAVRERVVESTAAWSELLRAEIESATTSGDIDAAVDTDQLVFEIQAFLHEANHRYQLHDDEAAFLHARRAVNMTIARHVTQQGAAVLRAAPL